MRIVQLGMMAALLSCSGVTVPMDAGTPFDAGVMEEPDAGAMEEPDAGPTCGAKALCTRTITDCKIALTQASCEAYYANAANCLDMAGYTYCNCYCVQESKCADYFACGQLCFNDYCR